jgi:hypothetical protein
VDYAVKIRVNAEQTGVDLNVKHSMVRHLTSRDCDLTLTLISIPKNPFDEIGL